MEKIYNHNAVEKNKVEFWEKNRFFKENKKGKKSFSIIMPPPNVTGKLHIGHAWDYSLQDLLIRYKKLSDFNVLYVPGLDHAGIATQAKVEREIWSKSKKTRYDLGKEKLLKEIWNFSKNNTEIIKSQWNKLGLAINDDKLFFTLDDNIKKMVNKIFVDLYNKKLIYQAKKMISFDVSQVTALSNIEVIHKNVKGKMYYFKYFLEDKSTFLLVATTRPETMFADEALVINSKDKRYLKHLNKKVINPTNNKLIPIIADDYVDLDYGTGVMKCTPCHDFNDYKIGIKNNLPLEICINKYGKMTKLAGQYEGLDRFVAREKLVNDLKKNKSLAKIEEIEHSVGFSQRSNTIVEPFLSNQWFISMKAFAKQVIKMQNSKNKINFFPENFNNNLLSWMRNIEDWCISRQLWWGHQIPVWYHKKTNEIYVKNEPPKDIENWSQDQNVLDTWFSSSLLPFVALGYDFNLKMFEQYFESDVLVTGYDIIFFWVSRMIFQTSNLLSKKAFKNVLIHGLIRDSNGLKMSKSLNNGIDPMDVIKKYGTDSLRFFLLTNSSPGKDLKYSDDKIKYAWSFINKIWNASRFVLGNIEKDFKFNFKELNSNINNKINIWILKEFQDFKVNWFKNMEKYEFALAAKSLIEFFWDKYCSWYIEFAKVNLLNDKVETLTTLIFVLKECLKMLHPYIPFITEEIYQKINLQNSILEERYENFDFKNKHNINEVNIIIQIINKIREFRAAEKLSNKNLLLKINLITKEKIENYDIGFINKYINKFVNTNLITFISNENISKKNILISAKEFSIELIADIELSKKINNKLQQELEKINFEIMRSEKMLSNDKFLKNANPEKVKLEKNKLIKYKNTKKIILSKMVI